MLRYLIPFVLLTSVVRADVPRVVADIAPVHALVAQVMDGVGAPTLVVPSGTSPHHHAMRPSEAQLLSEADLVVWIGPGLSPWLEEPIEGLAAQAATLELGRVDGARLLGFRDGALFEAHDHDHGHGHDAHREDDHDDHDDQDGHDDHDGHEDHDGHDDHKDHKDHEDHEGHKDHEAQDGHAAGASDPHLWLDPENGVVFLMKIAAQLSEIDPDNAGTYQRNAREGAAIIRRAAAEITEVLAPHKGTPFIVLHDGFHYFEAFFGVEAMGAISGSDAETPGAARVRDLRLALQDSGLRCAFAEPQAGTRLVETVTEGMDVHIGTLDPLGTTLPLGPELYPQMLRDMAAAMVACFDR